MLIIDSRKKKARISPTSRAKGKGTQTSKQKEVIEIKTTFSMTCALKSNQLLTFGSSYFKKNVDSD